jgi:hypothetical protein
MTRSEVNRWILLTFAPSTSEPVDDWRSTKSQGMPSAADQSQWRRDASELNTLNIDLPKGKLLQNLLRIYNEFNEPKPWILCVLIHDTLKRIQVRRIRKSANSMWPTENRHAGYIVYSWAQWPWHVLYMLKWAVLAWNINTGLTGIHIKIQFQFKDVFNSNISQFQRHFLHPWIQPSLMDPKQN